MKKIKLFSLVAIFAFLLSNLHAQDHKSAITFNAGFSLAGGVSNLLDVSDTANSVSSYSIPAIQIGYDYYITNWFSMGAAASIQFMGAEFDNYEYETNDFVTGEVDVMRTNIAVRALFHYFNRGRIDMYSGVRMGITNWSASADLDDDSYDYENAFSNLGTNFAPQLVLYGLRGYFTENLGANFELAVGPPHFLSLGLNYRF